MVTNHKAMSTIYSEVVKISNQIAVERNIHNTNTIECRLLSLAKQLKCFDQEEKKKEIKNDKQFIFSHRTNRKEVSST